MSPHHDHGVDEVSIALVTISTSRTKATDASGDAIVAAVTDTPGVTLSDRRLVDDDADAIETTLGNLVADPDVDAIVTTGGTGITPDDVTIDVAEDAFEVELPGFGEHFRRRSIEDIGTHAIATRATAGVIDQTVVFCLPGSEAAVTLGTEEIILPEIAHLVAMATR
ncbi:MogA/MoaB family molybdenum cofactor biosynthesis protein [Halorhabdus sp. CBA1104]|uniref:MogA/MoaB family molybdenum cofactor biosynthesis protein n=1 Tax=Halorhabdus sp. CBA1104 TaxID=1380432 RepID=UPI0012B40488|nr:MogA/MoaB family molybdenum cofactor biosynthesis protein [Halorhabdus sp. CBA1104]QGN07945.1 MogA/MoaB family molybdenum cofactor biosynthesis protein [Halorhabdus sp. CBA1104]